MRPSIVAGTLGPSNPAAASASVVFPAPTCPATPTISPGAISSATSCSATVRRPYRTRWRSSVSTGVIARRSLDGSPHEDRYEHDPEHRADDALGARVLDRHQRRAMPPRLEAARIEGERALLRLGDE